MELKLSEEKKHGKDKVVPMRFFKLAAKLAEDFTLHLSMSEFKSKKKY